MNKLQLENLRKSKINFEYINLLDNLLNIDNLNISIIKDNKISNLSSLINTNSIKEDIKDKIIYNMRNINMSFSMSETLSLIGVLRTDIENAVSKLNVVDYKKIIGNKSYFLFEKSGSISTEEFENFINILEKIHVNYKYINEDKFKVEKIENYLYSIEIKENNLEDYYGESAISNIFLRIYELQNNSMTDLGILNNLYKKY